MTMAAPDKPRPTALRLTIWLVVGAIGVYLVVSGVLGIIAKGG
ncbi:MAG TPA: hypothetical protein VL294_04890 [Pseudolysinimonas sp.]|nr:hypothetical protein [Pseudolysinimonas sp.]